MRLGWPGNLRNQDAGRERGRARRTAVAGNYEAPIIREAEDGQRELLLARWGMPSPAFALQGKKADKGVTNIRNTSSPHWRRWLGPPSRCLVPFTSFSENDRGPGR